MSSPGFGPADDAGGETAARMIDALRAGSDPVDEGEFSMDAAAALAKMKAFQYADRTAFGLPLVEGLNALGAVRIELRRPGRDLELRATGVTLDGSALGALYEHGIGAGSQRSDDGLARLAIGVDMALGIEGVSAVSITHEPGWFAHFEPGRAPELRRLRRPVRGTTIVVDAGLLDSTCSDAKRHLADALRHADRKIDGLRSGLLREWDYPVAADDDEFSLRGGLERRGTDASALELWVNDVHVDVVPLEGVGFRAECRLQNARRDLSRIAVVRDATIERAVERAEGARAEAVRQLVEDDARWDESRPEHWDEHRVDDVAGRARRTIETRAVARTAGFMFSIPFYVAGMGLASGAFWMVRQGGEKLFAAAFMSIFVFSHGYFAGAKPMGRALARHPAKAKRLGLMIWLGGLLVAAAFSSFVQGLIF